MYWFQRLYECSLDQWGKQTGRWNHVRHRSSFLSTRRHLLHSAYQGTCRLRSNSHSENITSYHITSNNSWVPIKCRVSIKCWGGFVRCTNKRRVCNNCQVSNKRRSHIDVGYQPGSGSIVLDHLLFTGMRMIEMTDGWASRWRVNWHYWSDHYQLLHAGLMSAKKMSEATVSCDVDDRLL